MVLEALGVEENKFRCLDLLHKNRKVCSKNSERSETTRIPYAAILFYWETKSKIISYFISNKTSSKHIYAVI
jgi:hypothetical protein